MVRRIKSIPLVEVIICFMSLYIILKYSIKKSKIFYIDELIEETLSITTLPSVILLYFGIKLISPLFKKHIALIKEDVNSFSFNKEKKVTDEWNYLRLVLSNNEVQSTEEDLEKSMIARIEKLPYFDSLHQLKEVNLLFIKEIIKSLKLKHLPRNFIIKKSQSSLLEILFIEKGTIGVYINTDNSSLIFNIRDIYCDTNNLLKAISLKVDSKEAFIFNLKPGKLLEAIDVVNEQIIKKNKSKIILEEEAKKESENDKSEIAIKLNTSKQLRKELFNKEEIISSLNSNTKPIVDLLKKKHQISSKLKKTRRKLSRFHLNNIRYFFKEDFHNIFHFFKQSIELDNGLAGLNIIYLNNYNNEKSNEMIIMRVNDYQILNNN